MATQIIIITVMLLAFVLMGFMMIKSIKKHEAAMKSHKKKKGKFKQMPIVKNPGGK